MDETLLAQLKAARSAARQLAGADRDAGLLALASGLEQDAADILAANRLDVTRERELGTPEPLLDRLSLDGARLAGIAAALRQLAALPDPVGRVLSGSTRPNGLAIRQVTVPFGVIGMIYESRPNVTVDAAALVLKAGSSAVLRGSSSARHSNAALVASMRAALGRAGLPEDAVQLVDPGDRALVTQLLTARGLVDLVVPRGGHSLISHVVETASVPVIETGVGNCHLYVDRGVDLDAALAMVKNAKLQRPGVCNAIETLLVHEEVAPEFLALAGPALLEAGCELRASAGALPLLPGASPATDADWDTEFLDLVLAVKTVGSTAEAVEHIARHGSGHSEAIFTEDLASARLFQEQVDAAVVYVNASTRFTDGFEFGFGAELGISTQKLHARGPLGLDALVTSRYLVEGTGQVRS